jgi:SAM-dependent methyltransferase
VFLEFLLDSLPERRRRRYGDIEFDWNHRVDTTTATVGWRDRLLGALHSPYQPTDEGLFHEMLEQMQIDFSKFTFIDVGSGKGRTLLMASNYPFHRIVGVELLPELHRVAVENLKTYKSSQQRCFALECIRGDALDFTFPSEPTLLFLFNPLPESGLKHLASNIAVSLQQHPRPVFVLYHNPVLEHVLVHNGSLQRIAGTHQYSVLTSSVETNS